MYRLSLTYLKIFFLFLLIFSLAPCITGQEKEKEVEKEKKEKEKTEKEKTEEEKEAKPDPDTLTYHLLLSGPDVQGNLNYALMTAASEGNVAGIKWLIKNGAEIETESYERITPLLFAVAANETEAVKVLLENNADPNIISEYSETPLIVAVKNQNLEIAELLLRDSADINFLDKYDATPLHYASIYGSFYIVDMLLYYDAAIFKRTVDGTTPLMAAIWAGHADIADLLLQNGADPSEKDNMGFSPFLIAAQNGDTIIMDLLLKRRINIYDANIFNYDALDLCIKGNHIEAVRYLLKTGNKWSSQNKDIVSPYSVATIYGRKSITGILKENNISETAKPGIDQLSVSASLKHCFYDYNTGISVTVKEPVHNFGFLAGIDFKPFYTRILIKENEDLYYQYRDKSALVYAGIFKEIPLTDYPLKGNWSFAGSLSAGYSFGNMLKGTSIVPGNKFRIIPAAGFRWNKNAFTLIMNIEYTVTEFYKIGPIWVRLGASHTLYFNNLRAPGKVIKWY